MLETRTPAPSSALASEETETLSASCKPGAPSGAFIVTLLVKVLTPVTVWSAFSRLTLGDRAVSCTLPAAAMVASCESRMPALAASSFLVMPLSRATGTVPLARFEALRPVSSSPEPEYRPASTRPAGMLRPELSRTL